MNNVVLIGYGGHAKAIQSIILQDPNIRILGYTDLVQRDTELEWMGTDEDLLRKFSSTEIKLIMGIGFMPRNNLRKRVFEFFKKRNYHFESVIHSSAILANDKILLGEGVQIMPGSVLQNGVEVGSNSLINTGAIIEHETIIKEHVHIAPGAVLCGNVVIDKDVYIGAGSTILQNISVGERSIVAAGSVLTKSILSDLIVMGIPAKVREQEK